MRGATAASHDDSLDTAEIEAAIYHLDCENISISSEHGQSLNRLNGLLS